MDNKSVKEIAELARERQIGLVEVREPSIREEAIPLMMERDIKGTLRVVSIKDELDKWRTAPERRAGTARMLTLESLIAFVNRHKDEGTAVFGKIDDFTAPKLIAVIDYHMLDGVPRYGKHRAEYQFPLSPEWMAWNGANGRALDQGRFAAFVEDHVADLASPLDAERSEYESLFNGARFATPASLSQLSKGLEINVQSRVKEVRNLQSGEAEIAYDEVHQDGKGKPVKVPGLFMVSIPLFIGGERVRVVCRLRYRKEEGSLVWFYQMYRVDLVIRERLVTDLERVGTETGCPTFEGMPEA